MYLIAEGFSWLSPASWFAILMVAAGLGLVIFVHELGHFLVAKACGVKCEKFYIGFDFFDIKIGPWVLVPRSLVKFQWGETEYGIGIIPLGGYVKMLGQDDNPANMEKEMERAKVQSASPGAESDATEQKPDAGGAGEEYVLDPRSYMAKSVPQRMAIISAGVVMNLIFAVVFATIAFRAGVDTAPSVAGSPIPGGAAWQSGIVPGDRVIQIGRHGRRGEHIRFRDDLATSVYINGDTEDMEFLVRRLDGKEEWIRMRPQKEPGEEFARIGFQPTSTTTLSDSKPIIPETPAAQAKEFKPGDKIVAIDGEPLNGYHDLKRILLERNDDAVTFTVERKGAKSDDSPGAAVRADIKVEPTPMKTLGLELRIGPIVAVRKNSPAAKAGLQKGDIIGTLNGDPVGDPMTFPERVRRLAGEEVQIGVLRNGSVELAAVVPEPPVMQTPASRVVGAEAIGVAYQVLNEVASVVPGSPAAKAGMQPGDAIVKAQFVPADKKKERYEQEELHLDLKEIELTEEQPLWPKVHHQLQRHLSDTKVSITYVRDGSQKHAMLLAEKSQEWHYPVRGFLLERYTEEYKVPSLSGAFVHGLRQTVEDATKIVVFLKKLITGVLPVTGLGGPGTIAVVATSEAMDGSTNLLLFLTLLSANLAVINILPIPVLDGGHLMFLTAEGISGKPINEKWQVGLSIAGFAFIACLMLFVIGLDVVRLSSLAG